MSRHRRERSHWWQSKLSWRVAFPVSVVVGLLSVVAVAQATPLFTSEGQSLQVSAQQPDAVADKTLRTSLARMIPVDPDIRTVPTSPKKDKRATQPPHRSRLAKRTERKAGQQQRVAEHAVPPAVFRVGDLNVLGDSHTRKGGNKHGYASGATRMRSAYALLRGQDVDVVAFQEFEPAQKNEFTRVAGGSWGVLSGSDNSHEAIAWRHDTWTLLDSGTRATPYFGGNQVGIPWVLLRHEKTGREVYFISLHNPTSNAQRGNNQHWRTVATSIEVNLVTELRTQHPVILMGDFNERQEAFCQVTRGGLIAANGGTGGAACVPPSNLGIDWIFGTPDLSFSDYLRLDGPSVNHVTDHPLISATVTATDAEATG